MTCVCCWCSTAADHFGDHADASACCAEHACRMPCAGNIVEVVSLLTTPMVPLDVTLYL